MFVFIIWLTVLLSNYCFAQTVTTPIPYAMFYNNQENYEAGRSKLILASAFSQDITLNADSSWTFSQDGIYFDYVKYNTDFNHGQTDAYIYLQYYSSGNWNTYQLAEYNPSVWDGTIYLI